MMAMRNFVAPLALALLAAAPVAADPLVSRGKIAEYAGAKATTVVSGLKRPWAMAHLPDGSLVITERGGALRLVKNGKLAPEKIPFPVKVTSGGDGGITAGQGGLLDISVSPNFSQDKRLYFTYATGTPAANRTCVGHATWGGDTVTDFREIYCNPASKTRGQHFGSRIAHLPDGTMLVSIGDGGNPPVTFEGDEIRRQAQSLKTVFGSVIRLNTDGSVPQDNPFVGKDGARSEIWTYGHRNVQGIFFDAKTGDVWSNEHGAAGGDELNRLKAGKNYGWPAVTFSRNYGTGTLISDKVSDPAFADPIVTWLDTIAPSSTLVYRADAFPDWKNALVSGGLVARGLRVITFHPNKSVKKEWHVPIGKRVRDIAISPAGDFHLITDDGFLMRLSPGS